MPCRTQEQKKEVECDDVVIVLQALSHEAKMLVTSPLATRQCEVVSEGDHKATLPRAPKHV